MDTIYKTTRALILLLCCCCSNSHAGLITNGYSLDINTGVVNAGELEWLRWDISSVMSIDEALARYSTKGWSLATNKQMSQLFNDAEFGITLDSDEETYQDTGGSYTAGDISTFREFTLLFGDTYGNDPSYPYLRSRALYGEDADGDDLFNIASVGDNSSNSYAWASQTHDLYYHEYGYVDIGVALVRTASVPEPASISLLLSGALGVSFMRRNKRSQQPLSSITSNTVNAIWHKLL